eukprot:c19379_g1_i10.p1 GENE.c19379_g1_i10~~c19379_g1_i10.p1  ORF type:complete len:152 (-),score=6.10 c19379_g1_i10:34-489(-)
MLQVRMNQDRTWSRRSGSPGRNVWRTAFRTSGARLLLCSCCDVVFGRITSESAGLFHGLGRNEQTGCRHQLKTTSILRPHRRRLESSHAHVVCFDAAVCKLKVQKFLKTPHCAGDGVCVQLELQTALPCEEALGNTQPRVWVIRGHPKILE